MNYENLVKYSYIEQYKDFEMLDGALKIDITFFFQIPKSTSKKKTGLMLLGEIKPCKKPDLDNCIKSITDSLNTIAYKDDSQIVEITARKFYSNEPRAVVGIEVIGG